MSTPLMDTAVAVAFFECARLQEQKQRTIERLSRELRMEAEAVTTARNELIAAAAVPPGERRMISFPGYVLELTSDSATLIETMPLAGPGETRPSNTAESFDQVRVGLMGAAGTVSDRARRVAEALARTAQPVQRFDDAPDDIPVEGPDDPDAPPAPRKEDTREKPGRVNRGIFERVRT